MPDVYSLMSSQSQSAGGAVKESREVQTYVETLYSRPETPTGEEVQTDVPQLRGSNRKGPVTFSLTGGQLYIQELTSYIKSDHSQEDRETGEC